MLIQRDGQAEHRGRAFALGNNHHVAIFKDPASDARSPIFVPAIKAAARARREKTQVVEHIHPDGWHFVMSLAPNDMVKYGDDEFPIDIYRVQKLACGKSFEITLRRHSQANTEKGRSNGEVRICSREKLRFLTKLQVDPLGAVMKASD